MKRNPMSLKATINNIAKENKVSAQSVLQTYMLERLLERISVSKYAEGIRYEDLIESINVVGNIFDKEH
ncbi:MAG: hypothetical protein J6K42_04180 [Clostridia bacterium]|nr:hypothetical protein [Clostridia bacterium]